MSVPLSSAALHVDPDFVTHGIGVDLVYVPDFVEQMAQPGTRWGEVFTAQEKRDSGSRFESLAARWAAKEAFIKAWSATMHGKPPVLGEHVHADIEVVLDAWRRPRLELHGEVARSCAQWSTQVSLSHDGDYAIAYVVVGK